MLESSPQSRPPRAVIWWLAIVYLMIFTMVLIGGITRLTGSGLSMVEWHPLMGALPPLSEADWHGVFDKYKQFPQYQEVNAWMTLDDFKRIFFWEYLHRLFGRLIGVVFIVPWLVFTVRGKLGGRLARRTAWALLFGGLQGVLGWVMVKSGLVDVPAVSHYRLAAHLALAFFVACWILWILFDLLGPRSGDAGAPRSLRTGAWLLVALIAVQIIYGAFMAGTRAGYLYATFPDYHGEWIPTGAFALDLGVRNFFDNPIAVHFVHRTLGWITVAAVLVFSAVALKRTRVRLQRVALWALVASVLVQFALGMLTVIYAMPIWLAVAHQGGGFLLLSCALFVSHSFSPGGQQKESSIEAS